MGSFNATKEQKIVSNHMGERAYLYTPKVELVNAVLTSFIENTYYEKADKRVERIKELVAKVAKNDPEFVGRLAVFARDTFNMRSSSHVLIAELAKVHRGDNLVSRVIERFALRPDDLTEIVAYVGKPIPWQIKKGVANTLRKFDEYQIAKYRAGARKYKLVDVVNLTHPLPTEVITKLVKNELRNVDTWESRIAGAGGNKEKSDAEWKDLLKTRKLGYMAALRNLRNILKTGDSETIQMAADFISNPEAVKNSRQFPFRFLSAYEAVEAEGGLKGKTDSIKFEKSTDGAPVLLRAITKALEESVSNIPLLSGTTAILSDNSGSMRGDGGGSSALSANSKRKTSDIANLFALLYWLRADNTYIGLFGDELIHPELDRSKDIFANYAVVDKLASGVGAGTEQGIYDFFEKALKDKLKIDRVVIFSDMQIGKNSWYGHKPGTHSTFNKLFQEYKKFNPSVKVYSVDLRGNGTTVFSDGVLEFSGFSDKLFSIMEMTEQDKNGFVKQIDSVEI